MWDERKNPDSTPKIFKTQRIQTQKINTNPKIPSTNPENQTHSPLNPQTKEITLKNQPMPRNYT